MALGANPLDQFTVRQSAQPIPRFTAYSDEELAEALHLGPASWGPEAWTALSGEAVRRGWSYTPPVPGVRGIRKVLTYQQRRWTTSGIGLVAMLCAANEYLGWRFPSDTASGWMFIVAMTAFWLSVSILGPSATEMAAVKDAQRRAAAAKPSIPGPGAGRGGV